MGFVEVVVGVILPYVAVVVFVGGMLYRISTWKKLASPPMTLFPAPPTEQANTINTLKEAVFFKSLFKGDRVLWFIAWTFHAVLLLIFVGHFRVFTGLIDAMLEPFLGEEGVLAMSAGAGGVAGILILLAVVLLLVRRMSIQRVREVTGGADYAALLLIGAVIVTGNMMRFGGEAEPHLLADAGAALTPTSAAASEQGGAKHFDLEITRDYFGALATFSFSDPAIETALKNRVFLVHMCLAFVLIMLIPFSKILHLGGIFFTHQLVRKQ